MQAGHQLIVFSNYLRFNSILTVRFFLTTGGCKLEEELGKIHDFHFSRWLDSGVYLDCF